MRFEYQTKVLRQMKITDAKLGYIYEIEPVAMSLGLGGKPNHIINAIKRERNYDTPLLREGNGWLYLYIPTQTIMPEVVTVLRILKKKGR